MKNIFLSGRRCAQLAVGLFGFFGFHFVGHARAATINANSPSFADVSAAIGSASDGDTVIVPAGTASWTQTLGITKAITLQGQTTVSGDHTSAMTANDQTIIQDDVPLATYNNRLISFTPTGGTTNARLTGFTFSPGTRTYVGQSGLLFLLSSSLGTRMRMDHCHFNDPYQCQIVVVYGYLDGVSDHCIFDAGINYANAQSFHFYNGHDILYGDQAWADPTGFGTDDFWFIEDCALNSLNTVPTELVIDCDSGGRYVARYSTFNNVKWANHGTESRHRSGRALEIYNNTFTAPSGQAWSGSFLRGGTAVIHDNTYTGYDPTGIAENLTVYRMFTNESGRWPFADGTAGWDINDAHGLYDSGTPATGSSGSASTATFTDNTKSWTTNQWVGYVIRNTTSPRVHGTFVISNTANTLTFYNVDGATGNPIPFNTGDTYEIRKVVTALDQPGRGQGNLLTGDAPSQVDSTCNCVQWPNDALEPVYAWNNTLNGNYYPIVAGWAIPSIQENRDYYNGTPMPGYTPYTYPHPLVSGGGDGPQAPGDLHIMP